MKDIETVLRGMRPGERAILRELVARKGQPVSSEKLAYLTGKEPATVRMYILRLRQAIAPVKLTGIRGEGYVLGRMAGSCPLCGCEANHES